MATNKNQHFVPRCYLRPFSLDRKGLAIILFNIDRQLLIRNAPVKNQCSGNYFYGKDEQLENVIQTIEREYAATLSKILESPNNLTASQQLILKKFWLFQYLRTEAASRRSMEMLSGLGDYIESDSEKFRLEIKEAVLTAMYVFAKEIDSVDDLRVCILRNHTKVPFVTSDDPAILTNRWYFEDQRFKSGSFGLSSAGAILLLPLSPSLMFLGYDADVYSVPKQRGFSDIKNAADVVAINEHQFMNCRANIFVQSDKDADFVRESYQKVKERRPISKHTFHYAVLDETNLEHERYVVADPKQSEPHEKALIHTQVNHSQPCFWPQQLHWRRKGKVYTNGSGVGYARRRRALRNPQDGFWEEPS